MTLKDRLSDLEKQLAQVSSTKDEIRVLNELAWELGIADENRARELANRAYQLAEPEAGSSEDPYQQERAASLITLGGLDRHNSKLDIALSRLYSALALLEGLPPSHLVCRVLTGIAWTYSHLGDYIQASDFAARAVSLARELKLNAREALALDAQATIYYYAGEPEQALIHFTEALRIFEKSDDLYQKCFVLNNMSLALMALGRFDTALASAQESQQLARDQSLLLQELNAGDTIAQVLLEMGNYAEAERYLKAALSQREKNKFDIVQVYMLSTLGKAHLKQKHFKKAASCLKRAVLVASTIGAQSEGANCHKLLSEVYEKQGLHQEALDQFRRFHDMNEIVVGEKVARHLSAQRIAHELENARREAETQRARAAELERKMNNQKRTQATLERLATLDPLTEIHNRRHFYNLALKGVQRSIRYKHWISVLMIDIDHFKLVNDQHGHAVGDQVIRAVANLLYEILRNIDIVGRLGGDEFAVVLPETPSQDGVLVAERIRLKVADLQFQSESGEFSITISIGVTGSEGLSGNPTELLDQFLKVADNALYEAKSQGRNQTILL
jgi:diguanylate cyclase (GGDEF)-like protein